MCQQSSVFVLALGIEAQVETLLMAENQLPQPVAGRQRAGLVGLALPAEFWGIDADQPKTASIAERDGIAIVGETGADLLINAVGWAECLRGKTGR